MKEMTLEERKVIYRARRGLMELDIYFFPYANNLYLDADEEEKELFAFLVAQEDPDLLDWFMNVVQPNDSKLVTLIQKMKNNVNL